MTSDGSWLWTDRSGLQQGQYRTDANLAARQSLYACQHPPIDLPAAVLDLAGGPPPCTSRGAGGRRRCRAAAS